MLRLLLLCDLFIGSSLLTMLISTGLTAADTAFFAQPQNAGRVPVKLYPMENVVPGNPALITFGMPFTRGSVSESNLKTVRVLTVDNNELPVHVSQLSPWRHVAGKEIDGHFVRFAMIQFRYTFSSIFPEYETVYVEWGRDRRTRDIEEAVEPRSAWHLVDSGTFTAGDSIYEPDVYAVLPKEYLCNGSLKLTRMLPIDDSVPEYHENSDEVDAITLWPDYRKMDHAQHNNFFTLLNECRSPVAERNLCPYKTEYEPWLYDRSTAMFVLYMRSGHLKPLMEAVRHTQFYRNKLWDDKTTPSRFIGLFKLKVPVAEGYPTGNGAMYSYNQCLAYNYWLTGDWSVLREIEWVVNAHEQNDEPTRWSPALGFWTERHTAFRLLANTIAYEVTGKEVYRNSIIDQYNDFIWHQNGAGGILPADRVDGGLYHHSNQHGDGKPNIFVASSWMTVLTVDAMLRVYALTEDSTIGEFIRRVGSIERAACKLDGNHTYGGEPLRYADYMMNCNGTSAARHGSMVEHSLEIASAAAWAAYFSYHSGALDTTLVSLADELYKAYGKGINHWINPPGSGNGDFFFRVTPWRKYAWEYVPSGSFSWLMTNLKNLVELENQTR
ncbi:MAG: hypothetical protein FVQ81_07920 [Candidatus Glassbacteria bacterium]|nr:hypothetical protein [Candidatus Glassbacteria bacterium]